MLTVAVHLSAGIALRPLRCVAPPLGRFFIPVPEGSEVVLRLYVPSLPGNDQFIVEEEDKINGVSSQQRRIGDAEVPLNPSAASWQTLADYRRRFE